ncbi:MAG: chromosome segregation protein SMC [Phycisphaerales bacterium]|nr:chromosome segregation protein SMC [Phycisphaerales bacterium]
MYLKRISMSGFKSFAERVEFDFSPGVTCIVGPNGCGKSNVVDAFKWVLGEQSAKLLRGRQMLDMIFNGSSTRRSSGMAEVDLLFDNADRALGLDRDEVLVTRKLFRSGESEYLLNKEAARLKDIRELFLDTGVGADTYSVIEQGRVDHLLTASSVERRAVFEEAAGIAKYKARKREAERKLERTDQNLLRVVDIMDEVQKRLRSVRLQATKARKFQEYDSRLKELRASYSLAEYHRLTEAIAGFRRAVDEATDAATAVRTEIDQHEADGVTFAVTINEIDRGLASTEQGLMKIRADIAAHEERVDAAGRRIAEQQAHLDRVGTRREQLERQRSDYEAQIGRITESAEGLERDATALGRRVVELEATDASLAVALNETRASVEDEKTGLVDLVRRSAQIRNEVVSLSSHREKLAGEHERLGRRESAIRDELGEYLRQQSALTDRTGEIDALIDREMTCLNEKRAEGECTESKRQRVIEELGGAKEERSGLRSRLELLDDLQRKREGVGAGVRALLDRVLTQPDDKTLTGVRGMVGELFDADVMHARIVEAAVGEVDQFLVLSESDAFLSQEALFADLPGRLRAVCLDRLPPVINEYGEQNHPGFVAHACDLVRYESRYERLVKHLLGKTVVVDSLATALALSKEDTSDRRFVTLNGEVVEPNGCVSVGPASSEAGLIARKSERRQVADDLDAVERRIQALTEQQRELTAAGEHLVKMQKELTNAIEQARATRVEARSGLERVNEAVRRLSEERPLIAGEVRLLEQQIEEAATRASAGQASVNRLDQENRDREQRIAALVERIESLGEQRERSQFALTEARVMSGKLAEKRSATALALEQLRDHQRAAGEGLKSVEQERREAAGRIEDSQRTIEAARERLAVLAAEAEQAEADAIGLRRKRELLRQESESLAAAVKTCRTRLEEIEAGYHARQLELQTAQVQRDELNTRVRDELGLALTDLYESYAKGEIDLTAVGEEIADLRSKLERLGHVNLDAIAELDELEERDKFLTTQKRDLDEAKAQLQALIQDLDRESISRFNSVFEAIRENFHELFRKLFGGGKADIILEDPNDPLECGIEIVAKPPGKEPQRISLMSGGEKTMTAIALVMSIFRSRPAPFAILDEVDAALDEANNVRFNTIIQEFLDRSQFIVVTHSKRTMSIADHLYGITMQEPGVSSRVSVKFAADGSGERHAVA